MMPEVRLQTYWCDSDPAGIVYFANYLNLLDKAEEELFLRAGLFRQEWIAQHNIFMPRVEVHMRYLRPIRSGSAVRIRMNPQYLGEKTVKFDSAIVDDRTGEELATGFMTVVCVDRSTFTARAFPEDLRKVLSG
jgi:acyl-CoA thioester hydrolase